MDSSTLESQPTSITHESPFTLFSMAISHSHIALGTFLEDYTNHINILNLNHNHNSLSLSPFLSFPHPYPPTKLMFHPSPLNPSLLASSSDFLRLYQINNNNNNHFTNNNNNNNNITSLEPVSILNNSKSSEFCAPLTSFDWNELEPRRIGTSSIDTTCTIWDVEKGVVETQLIAHDKEVHDIAWGEAGVFASVSADGSVRVFDLRDKEHSTIIYESPQPDTPLLRLAWNKRDLRYMATILMDSNKIVVLDIRSPTLPVAELERHRGSVNAIAWAPVSGQHICSGGDDSQALIWDLSDVAGGNGIDPVCMYSAGAEINQVQWSAAMPDWIGIAVGNKMQLLKV